MPPLPTPQKFWALLPLGLLVLCLVDLIPAILGTKANLKIFRSVKSAPLAWLATAGVNVLAFGFLIVVALIANG
ncbi:MAG: hypothetical protein QM621_05890 [Aeromicrobium sp.]|uniref:hypothetical protein n=1 Tax=Aeromicrobium sp. TaxID=1871063 RepID=UPI0039E67784